MNRDGLEPVRRRARSLDAMSGSPFSNRQPAPGSRHRASPPRPAPIGPRDSRPPFRRRVRRDRRGCLFV